MRFDGTNDYIQTGFPGIPGANARTVELWFKGTTNSVQRFMVDMGVTGAGNGARFSFKINPSATVARIEVGGGGLNGTTVITNNAWHHLAVSYDPSAASNKYKIYVDGVLDIQGDIAIALNTTASVSSPMCFGIRADLATGTFLNGTIDDVRVWDVVRTGTEIAANNTNEFCSAQPGLVSYFKLNDGMANGSNTTVVSAEDVVNPLNVNTLNGFALTGTTSNYVTGHAIGSSISNPTPIAVTACSYTSSTGVNYVNSTTLMDTLLNSFGCDSIVTINFTSGSFQTVDSVSSCGNYLWSVTGATYTASGYYADTNTSVSGCDSINALQLIILAPTASTDSIESCSPITWMGLFILPATARQRLLQQMPQVAIR